MTGPSVPRRGRGVVDYLEELAEAKNSVAEYATMVGKAYDVLIEDGFDPAWVRQFLRRELVTRLLPKPPRQKRGRPKGALGDKAYNKRYRLCSDWIYEKTFNPSLTKEQFVKKRLGITDEDLKGEYSSIHRPKVDALLQELKPARMKQLDEGQRRALEIIYPLVITFDQQLARQWREAKHQSPALTKENFLQDFFGWTRVARKGHLHPIEAETIREYLERLDRGEKLLTNSERG